MFHILQSKDQEDTLNHILKENHTEKNTEVKADETKQFLSKW